MTDTSLTDRIIRQGHALVRAIEGIGAIEPTGWLERQLARLLLAIYKRRLRALFATAPPWVSEKVLNASGWREDDLAARPSNN